MKRSLAYITILPFLMFSFLFVNAQDSFKGKLVSQESGQPLPYVYVEEIHTKVYALTNDSGCFELKLPAHKSNLALHITSLEINDTINYAPQWTISPEIITVSLHAKSLGDLTIKGLSAKEVVKKAISLIKTNYGGPDFFSYGKYRQYDIANGSYTNLIEAMPVIMMRYAKSNSRLQPAYAVRQCRQTKHIHYAYDYPADMDPLSELMRQDPVQFPDEGSLSSSRLNACIFYFDTTVKTDSIYLIRYICNTSSTESHGIENYKQVAQAFAGEARETGLFVINKNNFAFERAERTARRYPSFSYYGKPNCVLPERKFFEEFIDGHMVAEYKCMNGRWYTNRIEYKYTNEYFEAITGLKTYKVTNVYEWMLDSVSRYVVTDLVNGFYNKMQLSDAKYSAGEWGDFDLPFYFENKDNIYYRFGNEFCEKSMDTR